MIIKQYVITLPADFDMAIIQTDQADALDQLQSVTREEQRIVAGTDLAALRNREIADARLTIDSTPGLLMRAVGINPETWLLVRFDYWSRRQDALPEGVHNYEVLHISAPNLETLKGYGSGSSDAKCRSSLRSKGENSSGSATRCPCRR